LDFTLIDKQTLDIAQKTRPYVIETNFFIDWQTAVR